MARLDGKVVRGTAAALGAVSVVLFVPEDLLLPRAAPSGRRRFLDLAIFNIERGYYDEASAFQKVLKSRNALLKRGPGRPDAARHLRRGAGAHGRARGDAPARAGRRR